MNINIDAPAILTAIQNHLAIIMFDTEGHVIWVNENFASAMGYQTEELTGMHHRKFCLPEFAASQAYLDMWAGLRQGKAYQDKIVRVTKDGKVVTLEASYMPVYQQDHVEAIVKVATDITERERLIQQSTTDLMTMAQEMTASTDEVLASSNHLVSNMMSLNTESGKVRDSISSIQSITSVVREIADQSHLLGLNAAIEAARAGETGRSFEVVANEIRKMAGSSKESSDNISIQLAEVIHSIVAMTNQLDTVTKQLSLNSQAISELKKAYQQITVTTQELASSI
ncbi:histidine kinase [Paenibacillus sambharensis]|uniref:Histidine kinase n=1 Tax=Paenibacillus sambharensis TaxID=1803190 RepID=A0A2W1LPJ4_9BACL|nr:methyl-accepting chemotaxis protein [Paenibacillus sambharensis]PZD96775.1 histidine kinase [Paenibacillus sambharensis]